MNGGDGAVIALFTSVLPGRQRATKSTLGGDGRFELN